MRKANLGTVLRRVASAGAISRAQLAQETGLNKSTVSSLVAELFEFGLVRDDTQAGRTAAVGRPATPVVLTGEIVALGLEISVDGIAACLEDLTGALRVETRRYRDLRRSDPAGVLGDLAALALETLGRARADGLRVVGAAVAVPGLVDTARGRLIRAPNLGWGELEVASALRGKAALADLPVAVENEANLAALAELWDGVGQGLRSFIHVSGEIGVGAGIVMEGRLYRGAGGFAGELGHVAVRPQGGEACACGSSGCLETVAGIDVIRARAGLAAPGEGGAYAASEALAETAAAHHDATLAAFDEAADGLGIALAAAVNLLDVEAVILGGSYTPIAAWLVPRVRVALAGRILAAPSAEIDVRAGTLGRRAVVRGAGAVQLRAVLDRPWMLDRQTA